MQYRLIHGMLSMAMYVLAGPIALPEDAPAAINRQGALSKTEEHPASPTPIDIKLDIGTLAKMFTLPPELQKLGASGVPLELRVSLGAPGKPDKQPKNEGEKVETTAGTSDRQNSGLATPGIHLEVRGNAEYTVYTGNGTPEQGWPTQEQWISYDQMKNLNRWVIMNACSNNNWGVPNNSPEETYQIFHSIDQIAQAANIDNRFILAILLEETKGCARVHTTYSADGVRNPGLMQSHDGMSTCNSGTLGAPQNVLVPCPEYEIMGMISDGVIGSPEDPDNVSLLSMIIRSGTGTVADMYRAARMYNSGPNASMENLEDGGDASNSYVADVANRLTGWVG